MVCFQLWEGGIIQDTPIIPFETLLTVTPDAQKGKYVIGEHQPNRSNLLIYEPGIAIARNYCITFVSSLYFDAYEPIDSTVPLLSHIISPDKHPVMTSGGNTFPPEVEELAGHLVGGQLAIIEASRAVWGLVGGRHMGNFVLIGGAALLFHGADIRTSDADFAITTQSLTASEEAASHDQRFICTLGCH
ncbi:hypothetical protein HOY80DRAFT_1035523 [Tuber brumale]|nr:hypothetical protein HOY80DRAFT_1035523 [Tuber brumale]